jgi:hypothetical protein
MLEKSLGTCEGGNTLGTEYEHQNPNKWNPTSLGEKNMVVAIFGLA